MRGRPRYLFLLNLGARNITGIDISEEMINIAQEIPGQLNAWVDWVCCDILDTLARLNGTADLVYTGRRP